MQVPGDSYVIPDVPNLFMVVLHPFIGTGLFEEVLFRGLVLKILLIKSGYTKKGIINAILISSVLFGLVHIINILAGADILPTLSQIVSATALGFFFAILYLRKRLLLLPIFFHGLTNLSTQIFDAITSHDILMQSAQNQSGSDIAGLIVMTLLSSIPPIIAGLILLRKVSPPIISNSKQTLV
jgi:membrane protease YdiL (CAAX protease family)